MTRNLIPWLLLASFQVICNNISSPRVILEDRVLNGPTCSLRLRYEFRAPHQTTLSVGIPRGAAIPVAAAVDVSFSPSIAGAGIGSGEERGGGASYLRQELVVTCARAFSAPPEIVLATGDRQSRVSETLVSLPVTVTTFVAGFPMTAEAFRHAWTELSSAKHTAQAVVSCRSTASDGVAATSMEGYCPTASSVDPATVRRLLVETLGMEEVVCEGKGSVGEVDLVAAAGVLLASDTMGKASQTCLVGVELHSETGAARVTSKSADPALAQGVQKDVLEGIRRLAARETEEDGPTTHV